MKRERMENQISLQKQSIYCRLKQKLLDLLGFRRRIDYINGSQTLPPPLSREEEEKMFVLLATDPEKARNELITHNLRLVVYIARKFESTGINIEDLISIGTIGLIKAVNTFSPEKKIKLATYASRCIENEILMHLRKNSHQKTGMATSCCSPIFSAPTKTV